VIATLEKRLATLETLIDRLDRPAPSWPTPVDLAESLAIDLDVWQRRLLLSTARRVKLARR
jgi:hypothetical protein